MEHALINTLVLSIVAAFVFGLIADRVKFPAIFGYLMAGVMIGPHTPGVIADAHMAQQFAEIGIILLMFGVGLHFSFDALLSVQKIAIPGAIFQVMAATFIGATIAVIAGYDLITGFIFGLSLSVASTVVLLRALELRGALGTDTGKIAAGWLIVEDILMVLALVLLPAITDMVMNGEQVTMSTVSSAAGMVLIKIGIFAVMMIVIGRKAMPWLLVTITKTTSRELAMLGTLAISLGFAYLAFVVFDASFALGAFLAGMVFGESEIGHKAAEQSLPMRDAFAVLFFVSVGMLFDPMVLIEQPIMVIVTLGIIIGGKSAAAMFITHIFRQSREVSMTIAISLAQIGEFSFILAGYALAKGLMPEEMYNLVLAGALLSIAANPFLFRYLDNKILAPAKVKT